MVALAEFCQKFLKLVDDKGLQKLVDTKTFDVEVDLATSELPTPQVQPQAPIAQPQQPQAPIAPIASVVPSYSLDDIRRACGEVARESDQKRQDLISLFPDFGISTLDELAPKDYETFVGFLRALGGKI